MSALTADDLVRKHCAPCEGSIPPLAPAEAEALLKHVEGWTLSHQGRRLRREWTAKNFQAAVDFFNRVAELAEQEGHHPDLHLEGYRHVALEVWTHAIGGLSENDFILAAKINRIPFATRR
jgi:4a-hydroxytetrahydrobiopterin dehydratase